MTPALWRIVQQGATWSAAHAVSLRDSHWIGGNVRVDETYGYASYAPGTGNGVFSLRNPDTKTSTFRFKPSRDLDIPPSSPKAACVATLVWGELNPEADPAVFRVEHMLPSIAVDGAVLGALRRCLIPATPCFFVCVYLGRQHASSYRGPRPRVVPLSFSCSFPPDTCVIPTGTPTHGP